MKFLKPGKITLLFEAPWVSGVVLGLGEKLAFKSLVFALEKTGDVYTIGMS